MRRHIWIILILLLAFGLMSKAWAVISSAANVAKENGYAVLKPPAADAVIPKYNGYAVLKPPAADAVIPKYNGYVILKPPTAQAVLAKFNAYAVVVQRYPSVQIIQ